RGCRATGASRAETAARNPCPLHCGAARGRSPHRSRPRRALNSIVSSIEQIAAQLQTRAVSPVDLVRRCLDRIEARMELNAFITVMADSAIGAAQTAEREIGSGRYRGPLHGIPISVKDLVDVAGTPTTSASAVPPRLATRDAPIVSRLRDAG